MKKTFYFLILFALSGPVLGSTAAPSEYEIKAAFLYNFAKFVEWPPENVAASSSTFVIGILGRDPFGEDLDNLLAGKKIQDRNILLKRVSDVTSAAACNMLFISSSKEIEVRPILESLKGLPVLTVSDMDDFIQRGGMVGFSVEGNKIRFGINTKAADSAKLKVSSQLLKLAKRIISRRASELMKYACLPFNIIQFARS